MSAADPRRGATILVVSAAAMWASAFTGIHLALTQFSPEALVLCRFTLAGVMLIPLAIASGMRMPTLREFAWLILLGLLGFSGYQVLLCHGQRTTSASVAAMLVSTTPLITAIFARLRGGRLSTRWWIGTLISMAGVAGIVFRNGLGSASLAGVLLIITGVVLNAGYIILQKRLLRTHSPIEITAWAIWLGTIPLWWHARQAATQAMSASTGVILAVVFLALVPGVLANWFWARGLGKLTAHAATSTTLLIPVFALLIAVSFGERPGFIVLGFSALVVLGVAVAQDKTFSATWAPLRRLFSI